MMKKGELAKAFCCPISTDIFYKPVTTQCGHTFELEEYNINRKTRTKCAECNTEIGNKELGVNITLRSAIEYFIDKNPAYKYEQYFSELELHNAIKDNAIHEVISRLTYRDDKLNKHFLNGKTPLQIAVLENRIEIVAAMLETFTEALDVNLSSYEPNTETHGFTALHFACSQPTDVGIIELLMIHEANTASVAKNGMTPLMLTAKNQYSEALFALLTSERPLAPNSIKTTAPDQGYTALMYAASMRNNSLFTSLLALPDIDVNATGCRITPLAIALKTNLPFNVERLIKATDAINITIPDDHTLCSVIDYARRLNLTEMVKILDTSELRFKYLRYLMKHGQPQVIVSSLANIYNVYGSSEFKECCAAIVNPASPERIITIYTLLLPLIIDKMIERDDADTLQEFYLVSPILFSNPIRNGYTIFHLAIVKEKMAIFTMLLSHSNAIPFTTQVTSDNLYQQTAAHIVCNDCQSLPIRKNMIDLLIENNADFSAKSSVGATPLINSILTSTPEVTDYLLRQNTSLSLDATLTNHPHFMMYNGYNALMLAAEFGMSPPLFAILTRKYKESINLKAPDNRTALTIALNMHNLMKIILLIRNPFTDLMEPTFREISYNIAINPDQKTRDARFFQAYYFIESLLNDKITQHPPIDSLLDLTDKQFETIFIAMHRLQHCPHKIKAVQLVLQPIFPDAIKEDETTNLFDFTDIDQHYALLNDLFLKAKAKSTSSQRINWQLAIRESAYAALKKAINPLSVPDKIRVLKHAKCQSIFATHRIFSLFGETTTVDDIEDTINLLSPDIEKPTGKRLSCGLM